MKRKILALLLAGVLVLSLAACAPQTSSGPSDTEQSVQSSRPMGSQTDSRPTDTDSASPDEGSASQTDSQAPTDSQGSTDTNLPTDSVRDTDPATDPATDSDPVVSTQPEPEPEPEPVLPKITNKILACDQLNNKIVLYDLSKLTNGTEDLEKALVWQVDAGYCADMKYREDTVFGDVVITAGTNYSAIFDFATKKKIWSTKTPGNNPHAVEILPDGDIVIANSTGKTLRHFNTSVLVKNKNASVSYKDYTLSSAHGVVWDADRDCLWALGDKELRSYSHSADFTLTQTASYTLPAGNQSGHDLSADRSNSQYLYLTSITVLRFDKDTGTFEKNFPDAATLSHGYTTGFGTTEEGHYYASWGCYSREGEVWENKNIGGWCTDVLHFYFRDDQGKLHGWHPESSGRAFYKVRVFDGRY